MCAALRKMSSVLRLGVYRERIEKYGVRRASAHRMSSSAASSSPPAEEIITVTLERQPGLHLGIRYRIKLTHFISLDSLPSGMIKMVALTEIYI